MTTNLFVIANVKQLRTGGSFRISLPFFRTSWGVGVLNSAIFNSFRNRVEFGTILEGLRNVGGGGGFEPPKPPPLGTPLRCFISLVVMIIICQGVFFFYRSKSKVFICLLLALYFCFYFYRHLFALLDITES